MVAVLIEVDVREVERDAGLTALREQIVPAIRSLSGFRSGTWLTGDGDGKGLSLTLWDSDAKAQTDDRPLWRRLQSRDERLGRAL